MLLKESQWFAVDPQSAYTTFRDMFANYKDYKEKSIRQAFISKSKFSFNKMVEQIEGYLKNHLPEFPKPIKLKLPKIDKIKLPKVKKLENVEG